jgi:dolichol-phosphate mannosyltransferase
LKTIDIVTSAYNEESALPILYERLVTTMKQESNYQWRLIICENVSSDSTWEVICGLATRDSRVLGIRMARNFLFDAAISCGLDQCSADLVVVMCSDLQDPPELISKFLRGYEQGYDHVVAKITKRDGLGLFRKPFVQIYYFLIEKASGGTVRRNVSDFRLMSKKLYEVVNQLRERKRFMRGLMSWPGFKTLEIPVQRPPRVSGSSKFAATKFIDVFADAFESLLAFSIKPLKFISFLGFGLSFVSFVSLIIFIVLVFTSGVPFAGFGTIVSLILVVLSTLLLSLGIIGRYVGLIYEETKLRPLYVIEKKVSNQLALNSEE